MQQRTSGLPVVPGGIQSRRCIMNRTPPPPRARAPCLANPPVSPWPPLAACVAAASSSSSAPTPLPSCNHVHPPHQPIISPYYVTSRCVTCLATPRRCSSLVGNSKNDGEGGKKRSRVPETRETSRGYGTKI